MGTRRLLFVRPPRKASLVPIYGALVLLASLGVAGLGLALWADAASLSAQRQDDRKTVSAPADTRPPRPSGTWM
jgi:hypothetical protein